MIFISWGGGGGCYVDDFYIAEISAVPMNSFLIFNSGKFLLSSIHQSNEFKLLHKPWCSSNLT